jgi:tight adherence protein C
MVVLTLLAVCSALAAGWVALRELAPGNRALRASLTRASAYGRTVPVASGRGRRGLPGIALLTRVGVRLTPRKERASVAARLHAAGFSRLRPEAYFAVKGAFAVGGVMFGAAVGAGMERPASVVLLAVVAGAIGFLLPTLGLTVQARRRREQMLAELPNALDLLAVSVEAGLGLDAALSRYAETVKGPLAEELALLVAELRVGASRAEVLGRLSDRIPAQETKTFVRSIVRADRLGSSLSSILRTQAGEVRYRRQAVAEEKASRAPVKMLFPTVLCIFPVLFVVVLGPAILDLLENL